MDKNRFVKEIKNIWSKIKTNIISKDKKLILNTLGNILSIIFVAIIMKIPIIFLKTILLDSLNTNGISIGVQNIISIIIELIYILVALIYVYKRLKKTFGENNKSI